MGAWGFVFIDDHLGDAIPVSQVEEDQMTVVAPPVDPSREPGARPGVGGAKLPARVRAIRRGHAGRSPGRLKRAVDWRRIGHRQLS